MSWRSFWVGVYMVVFFEQYWMVICYSMFVVSLMIIVLMVRFKKWYKMLLIFCLACILASILMDWYKFYEIIESIGRKRNYP